MGVMSCSRNGCMSIMCDTYVQSVGYVCNECKSGFKEYLQKNCLNPTTEGQISKELKVFMDTPIDTYIEGNKTTVDDFFNDRTQ